MKYSKAIRVAAVSLALSLAMPGQVLAAPEGTVVTGETPEAFQARTGYQLPAGWHYILENNCVILWSDETPVIEADFVETGASGRSGDSGRDRSAAGNRGN